MKWIESILGGTNLRLLVSDSVTEFEKMDDANNTLQKRSKICSEDGLLGYKDDKFINCGFKCLKKAWVGLEKS